MTHGASLAVDPLTEDVIVAAHGVDVAFDAAGIQASLDTAIRCVKPRGVVVNVAIWEQEARVNMNLVLMREITVTGEHTDAFSICIHLIVDCNCRNNWIRSRARGGD